MRKLGLGLLWRLAVATCFINCSLVCTTALCQTPDEVQQRKQAIESKLKDLSADISKLQSPLSRAAAEIEIADALWDLDRKSAHSLLTDAYTLTIPPRDESKNQVQDKSTPQRLQLTSRADRARNSLRSRIMSIAARDKALTDQLNELGTEALSKRERSSLHSSLARTSLENGDIEAAKQNIAKTFEIDPVSGSVQDVINDLAIHDRLAADALAVQYIQAIRNVTLTNIDFRQVYLTLSQLVFPNSMFSDPNRRIPPPGPLVLRSYAIYVVEVLSRMEQAAPGAVARNRNFLLSASSAIKEYAPELTAQFLELERLSRKPGQTANVPTKTLEEREKEWYEQKKKAALDTDRPDVSAINALINRGEFDHARTAIDKLRDGNEKVQLLERTNALQARHLLTRGDVTGAGRLALQLTKPNSLLNVYPAIIQKCTEQRDQLCATNVVNQAVKQLRVADKTAPDLPKGIPEEAILRSSREVDPVVQTLARFALTLMKIDKDMALDVLDEMVLAANKSEVDSDLGYTAFEPDVFKRLAPIDEVRIHQAAQSLVGSLKRIVALAAIAKAEVDRLNQLRVTSSPHKSIR